MLSAQAHIETRDRCRRGSYGRVLYNRFRYYDPSIGRYVSADPIGQAGGINLYNYGFNDPINSADPFGLNSRGRGFLGSRGFFGGSGNLGPIVGGGAFVSGLLGSTSLAAQGSGNVLGASIAADAALVAGAGTIGFFLGDFASGEIAALTGFDPQTAFGDCAADPAACEEALLDFLFGDDDDGESDACEGTPTGSDPATPAGAP